MTPPKKVSPPSPMMLLSTIRSTPLVRSMSSSLVAPINVLVPIANGSESLETVSITNILSRFGAVVTVAAVHTTPSPGSNPLSVKLTRGSTLIADALLEDVFSNVFDMVILPGGLVGCEAFASSESLKLLLAEHRSPPHTRWLSAICAAPALVLSPLGHLSGVPRATCYPSPPLISSLSTSSSACAYLATANPPHPEAFHGVLVDGDSKIITAPGAGRSSSFAIKCGEVLFGTERAREVATEMVLDFPEKGM